MQTDDLGRSVRDFVQCSMSKKCKPLMFGEGGPD